MNAKDENGRLKSGVTVTLDWFGADHGHRKIVEYLGDGYYWAADQDGQRELVAETEIVGVVNADHKKEATR